MKFIELKTVRIALAIAVVAGFSWLNWWVLPTLGMLRLSKNGPFLPETGGALVFFQDGKYFYSCTLQMIEMGWSGVLTAWPYVVIGILSGLVCGYPLGEFARRRIAIEQASEKALRESEAIATVAFNKAYHAECKMRKAQRLIDDASRMTAEVSMEKERVLILDQLAEERMRSSEEIRRWAESTEKELTKAKAKIRRLEDKGGRDGKK